MFLFQRSVWFLTFSKTLQLPNSCHFTPMGTKDSRLLKLEPQNQAQPVPTGLKWFSFFSSSCDFRSYLCLWMHACYGDLLPSREMFKFLK